METASTLGFNGVVAVEVGLHKDLHMATDPLAQRRIECSPQRLSEEGDQAVVEERALDLPSGAVEKQEDKPEDVEEKDKLVEKDHSGHPGIPSS